MTTTNSINLLTFLGATAGVVLAGSSLSAANTALGDPAHPLAELINVDLKGIVSDDGAANRVVAGDMLRSLSQEIPAAVCHLHNDIDTAEAAELLELSVETFDVLAEALLNGNEDLGIIGAETRRKTVIELETLIADWAPIHDAALTVLADPANAEAANIVYASTDGMLDQTYHLLATIEGEYSHPTEILQSDLMLLEISGRMAAMNQRIAYEACRVWSHDADEDIIAKLTQAIAIYEGSQDALRNGMPALSIAPPPNADIAAKLEEMADHWGDIHDQLMAVVAGEEIPVPAREALYHDLVIKLHQIEELEVLYQNYSKRIF